MDNNSVPASHRLASFLESKWGGRILNFLIIPALLIASLLLPPISVGQRLLEAGYVEIPETGGAVLDPDGTQITIPPEGVTGPLKIRLTAIPRVTFLEGSAGKALLAAASGLPNHLIMKSPFYRIEAHGSLPDQVIITLPIPNDCEPLQTVDLYTWVESAGEQEGGTGKSSSGWQFLPSQIIVEDDVIEARLKQLPSSVAVMMTRPQTPAVSTDVFNTASIPDIARTTLAEINPQGLYLLGDGGIGGDPIALSEADQNAAYAVIPTLTNWGPDGVIRSDLVDNMLVNREMRSAHVAAITDLVIRYLYAGIDVYYRGVNPELKDEYVAFITELATALHSAGKTLSVQVESPTQIADDRWTTGAYDWQALGQVVDALKVPAIADPQAYRPGGQMEALLNWAVGQVSRYKLRLVISTYSRDQMGQQLTLLPYDQALLPLGNLVVERQVISPGESVPLTLAASRATSGLNFDEAAQTYWYTYRDDQGREHTVWLEDATSIAHKLRLAAAYNLGGVAVEHLSGESADARIWELVRSFQDRVISPVQNQFSVVWTVRKADGSELTAATTSLQEPRYVWTAPQEPGEYVVAAAISADGGKTVAQPQAVSMIVASPTPTFTPTPVPTNTPVPTPTPTFTPLPPTPTRVPPTPTPKSQAAAASPPTPTPKPAAPPSGNVAGFFGYGIQVHAIYNDLGPIISSIRGLNGFDWVKVQIPWEDFEPSPGQIQWGELDRIVNGFNAAGLKLLLSIPKAPNWARPPNTDLSVEGPPADPNTYANFVGQLAARYKGKVQAYEIWNEQNMDYEWGREPFDAGRYVQLLAAAYRAIKAQDPGAIVVSGALTPTGAPPPAAVDDMIYMEQMYQAGLKDWCDAVGAHPSGYNVPPDADWQTWSDPTAIFRGPSDNHHHSWVFRATMEGYRNIMLKYGDGNKRIWPTEFGWASSPTPALHYEYAADNTLEEQAQFTVKAYQMGKAWGWVGVMFLWNLNFGVTSPGTEMAQWGIVNSDWTPKPIYAALASMPK